MPPVNKQETQKFCFSMKITMVSHILKCTCILFTNNVLHEQGLGDRGFALSISINVGEHKKQLQNWCIYLLLNIVTTC